ncbi:hypothetical protein HCN51_31235 [Nonomuraea sp. FMUSA5-5]|uniref:Tetratricopeptide repeat protein n=1 Tax=Nonomuraea composti TaxID=2720023 RepID=A0ABX1B7U1_9ACTN|nr:hypothetical protein [Nonomuraea sp. FMUSA5-5]NJP93865.1 hypothetical protein [Nonomuraea sp. FMUSA5-5]
MIDTLEEAIEVAEKALGGDPSPWQSPDRRKLRRYVTRLEHEQAAEERGETGEIVDQLHRFAELLTDLEMREDSLIVVRVSIRRLERATAYEERTMAKRWNQAGVLLADHGELDEGRMALWYALTCARREADQDLQVRAMVNLSAVALAQDDTTSAKRWIRDASEMPRETADLEREVLIASLRMAIAVRGNTALEPALRELEKVSKRFVNVYGADHPQSLVVWASMAVARYEVADAFGDRVRAGKAIDELELATQFLSATLGAHHPQSLTALANLSDIEYREARAHGTPERQRGALDLLGFASQHSSASLGGGHPQSLIALNNLRGARKEFAALVSDHEHIDRTYRPHENDLRNRAKKAALENEGERVRLIAHAGASFFLNSLQRFLPSVIQALENKVRFFVIISNPWNNIGLFADEDGADPDQVIARIESSRYYREAFRPVIAAYETLQEQYPGQIEFRVTSLDIPGTTLLTSSVGFYEPYMLADPEGRTGHGLLTFEIEFDQHSLYYAIGERSFTRLWKGSSSVEQFREHEEHYKRNLRDLLSIPRAS